MNSGSVIVVNVLPSFRFKERSGLATSTRKVGIKMWGTNESDGTTCNKRCIPTSLTAYEAAHFLFGAENPPGSTYVSGSQDAIGLLQFGISNLSYEGTYWPVNKTSCTVIDSIEWLENVLWLVPLPSRPDEYDPLAVKRLTKEIVKDLAKASENAWKAILDRDAPLLGKALSTTLRCWQEMLPNTVPSEILEFCEPYKNSLGYCFSGSGGGFLMVISEQYVSHGFRVRITVSETDMWSSRPIR